MMAQKRLIQAVQVKRRQVVGLDDDAAWRDFIERTTGLRSLREMTGPQLGKVLDALTAAGAPKQDRRRRPRFRDTAQMRMIRGLWIALADAGAVRDRTEAAIAAFVRRQTGQDMGSLGPRQANAVVEALKGWLARTAERRS